MSAITARLAAEPAVVIGIVASVAVIIAQQLLANGIVTTGGAVNWLNFIIAAVPLISGIATRSKVTPA